MSRTTHSHLKRGASTQKIDAIFGPRDRSVKNASFEIPIEEAIYGPIAPGLFAAMAQPVTADMVAEVANLTINDFRDAPLKRKAARTLGNRKTGVSGGNRYYKSSKQGMWTLQCSVQQVYRSFTANVLDFAAVIAVFTLLGFILHGFVTGTVVVFQKIAELHAALDNASGTNGSTAGRVASPGMSSVYPGYKRNLWE